MDETTTPTAGTGNAWVRLTPRLALALALGALLLVMTGVAIGATWQEATTDDALPHCVSDDYSDGTYPLCYVLDVRDGVVVLDADDNVISR